MYYELCSWFLVMVMLALTGAWAICGEKDLMFGSLIMIPITLATVFIFPIFEDLEEQK